MMEKITVDLISSKEFSIENRGYSRQEVDEFLDDVCDEMERMEAEIQELRQKNTAVREAAPAADTVPSAADENRFREMDEYFGITDGIDDISAGDQEQYPVYNINGTDGDSYNKGLYIQRGLKYYKE